MSTDPECTWTFLFSKKGVSVGAICFAEMDRGAGSNTHTLKNCSGQTPSHKKLLGNNVVSNLVKYSCFTLD